MRGLAWEPDVARGGDRGCDRERGLYRKGTGEGTSPLRMAVFGRLIQFSHLIGFRVKYG